MTKKELRQAALQARRDIPEELRECYSAEICSRLLEHDEIKRAKTVMAYMAFSGEVDLGELCSALVSQGKTVVYPVCGAQYSMEAYRPEQSGLWRRVPFGISEPDPRRSKRVAPEDIDVVVVPCVAFDSARSRIGWGAGYYDRYLTRCPRAARLGAAFEAQRVEEIETSEHDIPLEAIATETGWY